MPENNNYFDTSYVGSESTDKGELQKSKVKEFLKKPLSAEDIKRYGVNKPSREVIRAIIQNG